MNFISILISFRFDHVLKQEPEKTNDKQEYPKVNVPLKKHTILSLRSQPRFRLW